jgi:hypothetical protein
MARASSMPRVPRLTAIMVSAFTRAAHRWKSSTPTWFVSIDRQARSMRVGRWSAGPMPSSQLYADTKLPPG